MQINQERKKILIDSLPTISGNAFVAYLAVCYEQLLEKRKVKDIIFDHILEVLWVFVSDGTDKSVDRISSFFETLTGGGSIRTKETFPKKWEEQLEKVRGNDLIYIRGFHGQLAYLFSQDILLSFDKREERFEVVFEGVVQLMDHVNLEIPDPSPFMEHKKTSDADYGEFILRKDIF